ncbi:hypothetical protein Leryth_015137 [Lithospermum erythrorhizon]|nr:hypothetical protein Leryth_015137 [Lithospermum erythrorhizon]
MWPTSSHYPSSNPSPHFYFHLLLNYIEKFIALYKVLIINQSHKALSNLHENNVVAEFVRCNISEEQTKVGRGACASRNIVSFRWSIAHMVCHCEILNLNLSQSVNPVPGINGAEVSGALCHCDRNFIDLCVEFLSPTHLKISLDASLFFILTLPCSYRKPVLAFCGVFLVYFHSTTHKRQPGILPPHPRSPHRPLHYGNYRLEHSCRLAFNRLVQWDIYYTPGRRDPYVEPRTTRLGSVCQRPVIAAHFIVLSGVN